MAAALLALAAGACVPAALPPPQLHEVEGSLDELAWLAGTWVDATAEEHSEEHWSRPLGGMMLGVNRTVRQGRTEHFEFIRIERRADGIVYVASPVGQPTAEFALVSTGPDAHTAVFENLERDEFPQRIRYRRVGDKLHARVEGPGEQASEWTWTSSLGAAAPPAVAVLPAPAPPRAPLFDPDVAFDDEWQKGDATALGFDGSALDLLLEAASETQSDSLLILKDGKVVVERYFGKPRTPIETMSMTKSIVSIVIGILLGEGKIASVDAPLSTWLPDWKKGAKAKVTLRHVLTHTSGLEHRQGAAVLNQQADRSAFVRKSAVTEEPGARFSYNNEATQLLADVVLAAAGVPLDVYAKEKLFTPLGITELSWDKDQAGNVQTFYGLDLTARDLARLGRLLLARGRHGERQLVPEGWVTESTSAAPNVPYHGLLWWIRQSKGHVALSTERLDALLAEGFTAADALRPLIGRQFSSIAGAWLEIGSRLDTDARAALAAVLTEQNAPLVQQPGPTIGFAADGWLGQQLIVLPARNVVAVRQHRAPADGSADDAYNKKHGFFQLVHLLDRAIPSPPSATSRPPGEAAPKTGD